MIATTQRMNGHSRTERQRVSPILGPDGQPLQARAAQRWDPVPPVAERKPRRSIEATYDLAQTLTENTKHWAAADAYDADSANSRANRQTMVRRSRYETQNNGYVDGLTRTHATFVIRKGPRLRLLSADESELEADTEVNEQIKRDWKRWCKAVQFRRKLWCMAHAKLQDGETLAIVRHNPRVRHTVKLDLQLIETEQCQSPFLISGIKGRIDGVEFDEFNNPTVYEFLPQHPGALLTYKDYTAQRVPAQYVLHWFEMERPGQHRGIPCLKSTLGLGAVWRRWREAVVAAAEVIADMALIIQTQGAPDDGPDVVAPFSTLEFQKRMMTMLPMGWNAFQPRGEQPPSTYDMFHRAGVSELARPLSMPYNLAAADSSRHSFASGKLDTLPYYMVIDDLDREDCNDQVLDPLFDLWWQEYILGQHARGEMLDQDPEDPPDHAWDWPRNPVADSATEVRTNAERIRTGQASPSAVAHENGESYEKTLRDYARDYNINVDDVRRRLLETTLAPKSGGMLDFAPEDAAGRSRPEANGHDAPNMEQMSMMVAQLAEAVNGLRAIVAGERA